MPNVSSAPDWDNGPAGARPPAPGELRHRPGAHTVSVGGPPRPRSRYVSRRLNPSGVQIIDLRDPTKANLLYTWWIDDPDLHRGGGMDNKYFKLRNRYYDVQSFQFQAGTPDAEVGAIVFDVSGLPDTTTIREIGRIREPASPGGFHNIFAYRHSDGRALLFATVSGAHANVYDMERFVGGDHNGALIARIPNPNPDSRIALGYHDFYVGYDPATRQDKFYGAGLTAYLVYDVTRPEEPELLTTITGVAGLDLAHTFTPNARRSVCDRGDGIPVRSASHLRPEARLGRRGADHLETDRCLDGRLEGTPAQP